MTAKVTNARRVFTFILQLLVSAATMIVAEAPLRADAPTHESSIHEVADHLIGGCLKYAQLKGFPPLSVAVVDENGALVGFKRQPGASPLTGDAAILKAQTAAHARLPTSELMKESEDPPTRDFFIILKLTTLPGGLPLLRSDASLRGAVGVSGAETAQDADCARQAVDTISNAASAAQKQR